MIALTKASPQPKDGIECIWSPALCAKNHAATDSMAENSR
jgi:hypothetical protein